MHPAAASLGSDFQKRYSRSFLIQMNDKAAKLSALIIASFSSFLTPFMISSINIALPAIGNEFTADAVLLSWVATSYLLAAAVCLLPFGKMADIYGLKKFFLSGQIIITVTSLLAAISISAPMLIIFRIFQGAGGAMVFTTGKADINCCNSNSQSFSALLWRINRS